MTKLRVFTSFDFEHDEDLRNLLVGQARNPDSPFDLSDWSLKEALSGDWKAKIRDRIRRVDQVLVLCGTQTHTASGVSIELEIAREEGKPYFLLAGRSSSCTKPTAALPSDELYQWTWDNLRILFAGGR